ncbi:type II toxin-antitoxin system prevent-host-death family antitoxin [Phenylobacterium sp.]|uniref:type II toxin-antitoxin system prevent-host-death family antitoxin n=1 Tax=Phenylobacterium sp. TaxID=1871053 RepID=UPI00289E5C91|nr:type II toxin-antitoxin system prevent-host-death family antitoxin [Phenylobacterium sp.]
MLTRFDKPGVKTTAAEISRNFGHWQDRAMQEPVLVTHHGRPRLVLLSTEEFIKLSRTGGGPSSDAAGHEDIAGRDSFLANMFEGFMVFDRDLKVRFLNNVAMSSAGHSSQELVGRAIDGPEFGEQGALLAARLRRVLRTGEALQFESRGFFNQHRFYESKAFPLAGGVGLTFCQLTELYDLRQDLAASRAGAQAVDGLDLVGRLTVNPMGFVQQANLGFCGLVGLPEPEVHGARLLDFFAPASRQTFERDMNALLQGTAETYCGQVELLIGGAPVGVRLSAVRQHHNEVCSGLAIACLVSG